MSATAHDYITPSLHAAVLWYAASTRGRQLLLPFFPVRLPGELAAGHQVWRGSGNGGDHGAKPTPAGGLRQVQYGTFGRKTIYISRCAMYPLQTNDRQRRTGGAGVINNGTYALVLDCIFCCSLALVRR